MRNSLRWRLAWSLALLSTLAVLIQAIALFVVTEEQEEDMIDDVVNAALEHYVGNPTRDEPAILQSYSDRLRLFRAQPGEVPSPLPAAFATKPVGNHEWYIGDTEFHIGIREQGRERYYLLYDVSEHEARLHRLCWQLLAGVLFLGLASLGLGYWLAGRLLFQLQQITDRLQKEDDRPLAEQDLDREVGLLAQALDEYRHRNRELLAREREFAANVSHELRTPLTRARTSAELLLEEPALDDRTRQRLGRIVSAADDMEGRLRGLLFLARELALDERTPQPLCDRVEASAAHFAQACSAAGVQLNVRVPPDAVVDADPYLLNLLLDNLIGNAVRYTTQGAITIEYQEGVLTVADTGSGIAPEHLAHVFDRHYRASDIPGGMGLGLSIVERICQAHGWQCSIDSSTVAGDPHQGTRVKVRMTT